MASGAITVNRDYQRTSKVWPPAARSYLMDTILLGYPIPKLSLYQKTDLRTRRTVKEIVDGQQRSQAILDFFTDKFRITGKSEFSGRTYSDLDEDAQQKFIEYQLSVDVFVGATDADIRQVFRRMNSYTVPLNRQEKRHAIYQGPFKWFIVGLSERWSQTLKDMGVMGERQLSRMADAALISEILLSLKSGIQSASEKKLDDLYSDHDESFEEEPYANWIDQALGELAEMPALHGGPLMKPYNFYSLTLARIHTHAGPVPALQEAFAMQGRQRVNTSTAEARLTELAAALEEPTATSQFARFVEATSKATNRVNQRRARFSVLSEMLTN
jgi:hypothetical protein